MAVEDNKNKIIGVGAIDLLQIAFIILKLCNVINWSWWWVMAPTWIPVAIVLGILVIVVLLMMLKKRA